MKYISLFLVNISATTVFACEFDEILEPADKGQLNAQYNLCVMPEYGAGVLENDTGAVVPMAEIVSLCLYCR